MERIIHDVLESIEKAGFKAYLVGGYVRDYLRRKDTTDIDICTNATPKELLLIFKDYKKTPLEYGNVILDIEDYTFEITTFRKELKYKDNRKVEQLEYIDTLDEDLLRRDFTVNSICMDKDGKIIDLLHGKTDLNKKVLRSIGDPNFKLNEDSLRVLRAVRFATVLNFKLEKSLKTAIINNKELLKELSYERKKEELTKIFTSENKKYGVKLLKELGLLDVLELTNIDNILLTKDVIGMWSTICINNNYPFTKNEKELIKEINMLLKENINDIFVLYKYGLYIISIVCDLKKLNKKKVVNKYEKLPIKDKNEIVIEPEEICNILNKKPGPFLKDVIDNLEEAILTGKVINEHDELKNYILNSIPMI